VVALRRGDAELRLLTLPSVPEDEVAEIVRLQSLREFSEVGDDWPLDYLPLHDSDDSTKVLAALISPNRKKQYEQVLARAELRPKALVLRPTATALLVNQLVGGDQPEVELCVDDLETEIEMSVLREGTPILIRTVQAPPTQGDERVTFLCREIRRTMLAAQNQLHGDTIQRIVMFAGAQESTGQLVDSLTKSLALPVRMIDPFVNLQFSRPDVHQGIAHPGQFAAAVGLLRGAVADEPSWIDFLNPRKPAPPKSNKNLFTGIAVAAAICLIAGVGGYYWRLHQLDTEARQLQLDIQNRRKTVEAAEIRIADVASVQQWQQGDINWLGHLTDISAAIPDAQRTRFTRLQALLTSRGDGQMILEGLVDEQSTIGEIDQALRGESRRVRGSGGEFEGRDEAYPWRFKETVTIETAPKAANVVAPPASSPASAARPGTPRR
jgi:hypothetical protein